MPDPAPHPAHDTRKKVRYHCDSGLGIIHCADGRGNRLNPLSLSEMEAALSRGIEDEEAKILMIRSGEESFCLGMDLEGLEVSLETEASAAAAARDASAAPPPPSAASAMPAASSPSAAPPASPAPPPSPAREKNEAERSRGVTRYSELLSAIMNAPKPVVALLEGAVKAGGVGLAAACDIVIGTEEASVELSEVLFGLVPYNVLPYMSGFRMSPQRFRYLVLSAARLNAADARQFGFLDQIYSASDLEKCLRTMFRTMMRAEPHALKAAKTFFAETLNADFSESRKKAEHTLLEHMRQPRVREGLEAFHSGQTPAWFQRFKPVGPLSGRAAALSNPNPVSGKAAKVAAMPNPAAAAKSATAPAAAKGIL
ncbi:MAG: enoyl-CoA hydratase/isomerase family protein [Salinispira sp.]